jgi:hypothetical protein
MARSCFLPGPWCGSRHGQLFQYAYRSTQPFRSAIPGRVIRRQDGEHRPPRLRDDARIRKVQRDAELEHAARVLRQAPVAKVDAQWVDVARRKLAEAVGRAAAAFAAPAGARRDARDAAAEPVADRRARHSDASRDLSGTEGRRTEVERGRDAIGGMRHNEHTFAFAPDRTTRRIPQSPNPPATLPSPRRLWRNSANARASGARGGNPLEVRVLSAALLRYPA